MFGWGVLVRWSGSSWCPAVVCVLVAGGVGWWWLVVLVYVVMWVLCAVEVWVWEGVLVDGLVWLVVVWPMRPWPL